MIYGHYVALPCSSHMVEEEIGVLVMLSFKTSVIFDSPEEYKTTTN